MISKEDMTMKYTFRVELIGYGNTEDDAWDNALEGLEQDPGERKIIEMEEETV